MTRELSKFYLLQVKVNGNNGKELHPTLSDCSVSPIEGPKAMRRSSKEKNKKIPTVAPRHIVRALFKKSAIPGRKKSHLKGWGKGTIDAGPFCVNRGTSKDDIDLLKFIFMDMEQNDLDYR